MIETKYKPAEELKFSVGESQRLAILSCGACANLCDVGGVRGMVFIRNVVESWGKEVVAARTIAACCPEPIMRHAQGAIRKKDPIDGLIVISCAGGVKSAMLCQPGVPVIAACDTIGAASLVHPGDPIDSLVTQTPCKSCEHCVLSFTAGICPLAVCPARSLYGPCKKAPTEGKECILDPDRDCIWREIEGRGADLEALQALKALHQSPEAERLPSLNPKSSGDWMRRYVGVVGGLIPGKLLEVVHWAR